MHNKLLVPFWGLVIGVVQVAIIIAGMNWFHFDFGTAVLVMFSIAAAMGLVCEGFVGAPDFYSLLMGAVMMVITPIEYLLRFFVIPVPAVLSFPVLAVFYIICASIKDIGQADALTVALVFYAIVVAGQIAFSKYHKRRPR